MGRSKSEEFSRRAAPNGNHVSHISVPIKNNGAGGVTPPPLGYHEGNYVLADGSQDPDVFSVEAMSRQSALASIQIAPCQRLCGNSIATQPPNHVSGTTTFQAGALPSASTTSRVA